MDQYLNIKLADVRQPDPDAASPALASARAGVDTELLHDATRREARGPG